uniref:F-box domain-containing protein n=1 Tax=viral metagenome TaxID=1070528 RepID=A0A6C0CA66_9ZZZZ
MEYIHFNDILKEIKDRLIPIDLYNFARTCKRINKLITMRDIEKSTIDEINRRLSAIFDENFQGFKAVLQNSNAAVVGEFVTQCILGEYWDTNAIAIHLDDDELNHLFDRRTKKFKCDDIEFDKDVNNMTITEYMFLNYKNYRFKSDYHKSFDEIIFITFIVGCTKITFSCNSIEFDKYNICKNMYTCQNKEKVSIFKINEIFTKCTNFYPNESVHLAYRTRGFSFYDYDNVIIPDNKLFERMDIRVIKIVPCISSHIRFEILSKNKYHYKCDGDTILHSYTPSQPHLCIYKKIYHLPCLLEEGYITSCICHTRTPCLFEEIHPGVEHLHGYISNVKILFIIDTFKSIDMTE